jgi:hypothetical protein
MAKRHQAIVINIAKTMMVEARLPDALWVKAVEIAVYMLN